MGGSLALSLKPRCRRLSAYDPDLPTLELARRQEIVHFADSDPAKVLASADLVILACPVPAILDWLDRLPEYIQHPCIVLDIGSSKRAIVAALESLPAHFDPIGGHPDLWPGTAIARERRTFSVPRSAFRSNPAQTHQRECPFCRLADCRSAWGESHLVERRRPRPHFGGYQSPALSVVIRVGINYARRRCFLDRAGIPLLGAAGRHPVRYDAGGAPIQPGQCHRSSWPSTRSSCKNQICSHVE